MIGRAIRGAVFFMVLVWGVVSCGNGNEPGMATEVPLDTVSETKEPLPEYAYGFCLDSFKIVKDTVQKNQVFSDILLPHRISWGEMETIDTRSEGIFNINRDLRPDQKYQVLCGKDSIGKAEVLIYEKNAIEYIVFDLRDSITVRRESKDVEVVEKEMAGIIAQGSSLSATLYDSLKNASVSESLVDEIADVYAYTIDFFNIKAGDRFKVIYEEQYVDEKLVGRGAIRGVYFHHNGVEYYGIKFMQDSAWAYFDENGKGLKKAFLKAPLKFSRISSGFSKRRFHPVQKRYKPHLGTDYAAPTGTPILSVADGTVVAKGYGKGNGNYVKIKHNRSIATQYLHMSKFARGIKKGMRVKQGEVIGYVGSTGLATGPHVCFRFWKSGRQVDHRKEKFETSDPIKEANREAFNATREKIKKRLDDILIPPTDLVSERWTSSR